MTTDRATAANSRSDPDLPAPAKADGHRPRFHFTAPAGWLNDPNGLGQWHGVYHLFYQWNPYACVHDGIHWGHTTSTDLINWSHEPVALVPSAGPDEDGCWSGVLVDDGGVPTLVYSGHRDGELEVCCLATGTPDLESWTKDPANPVLSAPSELDPSIFRDHCVWREGDTWRQVIGSGAGGEGMVPLFESDDLRHWRHLGSLTSGGSANLGGPPGSVWWTGSSWECPDFFHLDDDGGTAPPNGAAGTTGSDVLVFSAWEQDTLHTLSFTGTYRGDTYTPTALHRVDLGERTFYAPQSFRDDSGRRVMFGWLQEERAQEASVAAGWSGAMSLPRHLRLVDGLPHYAPVAEVESLRRDHFDCATDHLLAPGRTVTGPSGDQLDLELELLLPMDGAVELALRATPDAVERTILRLHRDSNAPGSVNVRLDRSRASLDQSTRRTDRGGQIRVDDSGHVSLRVLVDHSVIEVFCNGQPLSARVYPTRDDALDVQLSVPDGCPAVTVQRFAAWTMAPRAQ